MATQLITLQYGDMSVLFQADAFINATAIAKQFGKRTENYLRVVFKICWYKAINLVKSMA